MDERLYELPEDAQRLVLSIQALVSEAQARTNAPDVPPELTFTLRETVARYLPDTIAAYLALPVSQRTVPDATGRVASELLLEQLSVLDRSVRRTLATLAEHARSGLSANARFLAERFDDHSSEISTAAEMPHPAAMQTALPAWFAIGDRNPGDVVALAAQALRAHLSSMVQVHRGGLLGMGAVEAVDVTLPQGGGTSFRYTLSAREGALETTVAKLVHGTAIQRVVCSPHEWLQSLYDDVAEQARRHNQMRAAFASLFNP